MTAVLGDGEFRYEAVEDWARLPSGWELPDISAVAVDSRDRVFLLTRGPRPLLVFAADGGFLASWGEGLFHKPHGLQVGPDDSLYCSDEGHHRVFRFSPAGELLREFAAEAPAPYMSGRPFNRCTHTALAPNGDLYVADGYGNARVHRFSAAGRHLASWGRSGVGPGEFNIVHSLCCDAAGRVYVADRENHRIQVFDGEGNYLTAWYGLHRPCGFWLAAGPEPLFYVGELASALPVNRDAPGIGPRISILDGEGRHRARLGGPHPGIGPGEFLSPHGLAVDSRGDIYVGELANAVWQRRMRVPPPRPLRTLTKLRRL